MPTTPGGTGIEHTNVIWTESLPAATCYVARELEKQSHDQHRRNAKQLHAFLTSKNRQNLLLNCDDTPYTALGNIPDTTLVWVVYGFSVGTAGLEPAHRDGPCHLGGRGARGASNVGSVTCPFVVRSFNDPWC